MASAAEQVLKALGDESRLRIAAVLCVEPLSVNELIQVVSMGQSRVSRHLRILADAGILEGEREGSHVYYRLPPAPDALVTAILSALRMIPGAEQDTLRYLPAEAREDRAQLLELLATRREAGREHFQRHGADQDRHMAGLVDASYYRERVRELLPESAGVTADLGCGAGDLALLLRGRIARFVGVDQSSNVLAEARQRVPEADFRLGGLDHPPLRDGEADTVIFSMALHHLPEPRAALLEAHRIMRPGGTLMIAELAHHEEELMRQRFADFWLGFRLERLHEDLRVTGFTPEVSESGRGQGRLECIFLRATRGTTTATAAFMAAAVGSARATARPGARAQAEPV